MKILFVNYQHMDTNSGIHIFNLANRLTELGLRCVVAVPKNKNMVFALGQPLFQIFEFNELFRIPNLAFDIIHVWTPREVVRKAARRFVDKYACPYLVHLEDNEEYLAEVFTGRSITELEKIPVPLFNLWTRSRLSHPGTYKDFLRGAVGITGVIEDLKDFTPSDVPYQAIWAGYQEDIQWCIPVDKELKNRLNISDEEFVVAYTGNVHLANRSEVSSLYQSVWLLRQHGIPLRLLRTGKDFVSFLDKELSDRRSEFCIDVGFVPRSQMPSIISVADVLIQPGRIDKFNRYRFPSKLPEYLASGKPVILPRVNIGLYLKGGEECVFLETGDVLDISKQLEVLLVDESLRNKIAQGGKNFAEKHLKWSFGANKLYDFYETVLKK